MVEIDLKFLSHLLMLSDLRTILQLKPSKDHFRVANIDDSHNPTTKIDLKSLSPSLDDIAIVVDGSVKGLVLLWKANYRHESNTPILESKSSSLHLIHLAW